MSGIKDQIVVGRYAEAFLKFSKDSIGIEAALADLRELKHIIKDNPEFLNFLESKEITFNEKCEFINNVLKAGFSEQIKQFLKLLLEKERIDKILDIAEYARIKYSHGGEIEALLRTTFPLDLVLIKKIEQALEKKFNKKFKFYIDLDGSLLGGVQIVMGNTVIDGTVKRRLEELREKLQALKVN